MKCFLSLTIAILAVFVNGDATAQVSTTPPCRAGTLDLRAVTGPAPQIYPGPALPEGLIMIYDGFSNIKLSNVDNITSWSNWGLNNLFLDPRNGTDNEFIIRGIPPFPTGTCPDPPINIGNIDRNFWTTTSGPALTPDINGNSTCYELDNWNFGHTSEIDIYRLLYNTSMCTPESSASMLPEVGCDTSLGYLIANKSKGAKPQSDTAIDTCNFLFGEGDEDDANNQWQQAFDTLKLFVERCPFNSTPTPAWPAFHEMLGDVEQIATESDSLIWVNFREWLESVLYVNTTDPEYFCACVETIGGTFYTPADTTAEQTSKSTNTGLAVIQWLLQNTKCDSNGLSMLYSQSRRSQYQSWLSDSIGGVHFNLDTTLPTMAQLGLDTLLAKHQLALVADRPQSILTYATASPNPVSTGTVITFGISQEAYVKINLFDLLGAPVSGGRVPGSGGEGFEGLFAPGNHEVPLSLQGLPSGTYFARILTAYGNVATVKLVKEQ